MQTLISSLGFLAVLFASTTLTFADAAPCGKTVTIQLADTLSSVAARCEVTEASLLAANPTIQGSNDMQVGGTLHIEQESGSERKVGAAVNSFARRASNAIGSLAGDVGSSVQDLLDKNPDLKSRVDRLGSQVGLTGTAQSPAATVTPQSGAPGSTVTISASGLSANSPVAIGAGAPGTAYDVIGHAQSTADGRIETTLKVPLDTQRGQVVVFSIATGDGVAARTNRLVVEQ